MPFLSDDVELRIIPPDRFELLTPLIYEGRDYTYKVPAGFTTDLASVPRSLHWFVDSYGLHTQAAILHDWCWEQVRIGAIDPATGKAWTYADADGIFRRTLREAGVPWWRRWPMFLAVRAASFVDG